MSDLKQARVLLEAAEYDVSALRGMGEAAGARPSIGDYKDYLTRRPSAGRKGGWGFLPSWGFLPPRSSLGF